ncbi:HK97 family phage major capsid protein [Hoeflea marina]|uniref:HK97 family phage major capsid protein n=1 Tax=Hoeflea marina TaxID=274592 RepID=A0A317PIF5_9HYPH|nr:phage major capsid protein [Hoeflea marina]PWW00233.1 HK97 family phage major capsid protein [Hoeflea marina]
MTHQIQEAGEARQPEAAAGVAPAADFDIAEAFDEFGEAFREFRATNDARLAQLERRGSADALTEDKLRRLDTALADFDRLVVRAARPPLGGPGGDGEVRAAMNAYVRKGRTDGYEGLEGKGMSVGSEADGGYLVPDETETALTAALRDESPIRALASALTISTSLYKRPFVVSGAGSGWVAETAARVETSTPQLAELGFPAMELYACPAATKQLLDDSVVDIETWLVGEMATAFGEQETRAFIEGDGLTMPRGILAYPRVAHDAAGFGQVGTLATGTPGDFDPDAPADVLLDLVHSLGARYRRNGVFLMNRMTLSAVRRLKNADGDYLWQPRLGEGLETSLMGFRVEECEDMPDIAPGAPAIAFGDFRRAYLIVDRQGVQILRDPYSAKPYVLFYATKRVGGGITDFNALRLLTF